MDLLRFVPALLVFPILFVGIKLLFRYRASAMRAFALKWGFQYMEGDPNMWFLPKDHRPIPTSFRQRGYPVNTITTTWNLIEGERNGIKVLILDSVFGLGRGRGRYCTFIAARADENPFEKTLPNEKIAHSNGWTALYRLRFWQIPWTLSIQRIEEHLNNLRT